MDNEILTISDGMVFQDNKGCGYCGAMALFQALDFLSNTQNSKHYDTRAGETEATLLLKIADALIRLREHVETNLQQFSQRSIRTVETWNDDVRQRKFFL